MRKIERQMIEAIRWADPTVDGYIFGSGNTRVRQFHEGIHGTFGYERGFEVILHNTVIARWYVDRMGQAVFDHGGWETVTTKSRLNAVCVYLFGKQLVCQKDFYWYVDDILWENRVFDFSLHYVSTSAICCEVAA